MRETAIVTPRNGRKFFLVPETDAEREHGMNGGAPRPYIGMVFGYDPPFRASMTMKKTPFTLQIAFVGADRTVHAVLDAQPFSGLYSPPKKSRWVIETPLLWQIFRVGDRVVFSP